MNSTDTELLKELELRFSQNRKMIEEQKKLVSDLEKVNEKLIESEMLKSHFLSNIMNEINNPLTAILGLSGLMITDPNDIKGNASSAKLIYDESFILNFQLKNIFCAAEIESGQLHPEISYVNINNIMLKLCESFQSVFSQQSDDIQLRYNGPEKFLTDSGKLFIIMSNLLSNAIKFSKKESTIIIDVTTNALDNLIIKVLDFGSGIKEEELKMIFDRFKQLDTGSTKEFGGHGIGLSVVQSLVDLLNGEITVESEFGEGSTFTVSLPEGVLLDDEEQLFDEGEDFLFKDSTQDDVIF